MYPPRRYDDAPSFEPQGMRCKACDTPFRTSLPQNCAVSVWVASAKAVRCPHCGSSKILMGEGRSAAEDDAERQLPPEATVEQRSAEWLHKNGEVGASSTTIFDVMTGRKPKSDAHPLDVDDFRRCVLLLRRIPEWRERMQEMAKLSAEWAALAVAWPALSACFLEETNGQLRGAAPRTAGMLREILG